MISSKYHWINYILFQIILNNMCTIQFTYYVDVCLIGSYSQAEYEILGE